MIVIWRSWGIMAAIFVLLGIAVGNGLNVALGWDSGNHSAAGPGLGVAVAGVATFALGQWLNQIRPAARVKEHMAAREQTLWQLVRTGQFQVSPGAPAPRSEQEARDQVGWMLHQEQEAITARACNRSTIFFIPMQFAGAILVVVGLGMLVAGLIG